MYLIPKGIDDKYEIVKILQETAATAVLLVNYKQIGALRILKAIHRAHPNADSILSEANLLQGIKSSQIPTIFSVEDTDDMYYLVEEFIEGISLKEYLLETQLSREDLLNISINLCTVVEAIHLADPEPVLYRDLKPEHIILHDNNLKLIDFGISVKLSEAEKAVPLGTKNWAAPEQLLGKKIDQRCDIYSIGKIIEFMQINSYAKDDFRIKALIKEATEVDLDKRINSVSILKTELLNLQGVRAIEKSGNEHLCKNIAIIGADNGIGTTHIAINLCRYLNKNKITTYYKDVEKDTVHNLWNNLKGCKIKEGVLYHDNFKGIINYGPAIKQYQPPDGLYILDCGTDIKLIREAHIILFVTSATPWKYNEYPKWIIDKSVYVINNFSNKLSSIKLAKDIQKKVYMYPIVKDFFKLTKEEERIFSTILKNEKDFNI